MSERTCPICGASMEGQPKNAKYCTAACSMEAARRQARDRYAAERKHPVKERHWNRGPRKAPMRPLYRAIACARCAHGKPNAEAALGFECMLEVFRSCNPESGAPKHWVMQGKRR